MDEYDVIMLVETVLYAKKMEQDGKIVTDESEDMPSFALTMKKIAAKAQKAFGTEDDKYGGWDEAYATMEKELKKHYAPKKTYYVTFKVDGRCTVQVNAASLEEAKAMAEVEFNEANLNDMDYIDSRPVTVEDENDIVWEA